MMAPPVKCLQVKADMMLFAGNTVSSVCVIHIWARYKRSRKRAIQIDVIFTFTFSFFIHCDLGSLITEDGQCTTEFRTRLNKGQVIGIKYGKVTAHQFQQKYD